MNVVSGFVLTFHFLQQFDEVDDFVEVGNPAFVTPPACILDDAAFDEGNLVGVDVFDGLNHHLAVVIPADLRFKGTRCLFSFRIVPHSAPYASQCDLSNICSTFCKVRAWLMASASPSCATVGGSV